MESSIPATPGDSRAEDPWWGNWRLQLLAFGSVAAPAVLVLHAWGELLTFFGDRPTPEELARADLLLRWAAASSTGLPLTGLLLARHLRSKRATAAFALGLLGGGFAAGYLLSIAAG